MIVKLLLKKTDYAAEINKIKNDYVTHAALTSQLNDLKVDGKVTKNSTDILGFESRLKQKEDTLSDLEKEASFFRGSYYHNQNSYFLFESISKSFNKSGGSISSWKSTRTHNDSNDTDLFSVNNSNNVSSTLLNQDNRFGLTFSGNCINYKVENWIRHGSGWNVEEIVSQYLNISMYLPLSGSTYCKLPKELQNSKKGLINIQNNDNKCFLWCHVRYLNCEDKNLWRITKKDKEISKSLNYNDIQYPVSKKSYGKISIMNKININVFCYENKVIFPVCLSDQSFDDVLDLLLVNNHYVLIKDFNRLMFNKTKHKSKEWFCKSCLCCFSSEFALNKYKEDCLMINGGQNVKLEKRIH